MEETYIRKTFQNISIFGRTSYLILCFETYVLKKYPTICFVPVCQRMWHMLDGGGSIDYKAFAYLEIVPQCLYSTDTYSADEFDLPLPDISLVAECKYADGWGEAVLPQGKSKILHT